MQLRVATHGFRIQRQVRPGQRAVATDVGTQHVREADVHESLDERPQRRRARLLPAMRRETRNAASVETDVEREHEAARVQLEHPAHHALGLGHGNAADHCAVDAGVEQLANALDRAQPTADLQLHSARLGQQQHGRAIRLGAVACAVEIDDVHAARAKRPIGVEHALWVVGIDGFRRKVALQQAHAAPVPQIDGRNQFHGAESLHVTSRKLRRMSAPACADRSG